MYPMLSVEEAQERVLRQLKMLEAESVPILSALWRVLARDIAAGYDIPPHANSAMDGYAIQSKDTKEASVDKPVRLRVTSDLAAGYVSAEPVAADT